MHRSMPDVKIRLRVSSEVAHREFKKPNVTFLIVHHDRLAYEFSYLIK